MGDCISYWHWIKGRMYKAWLRVFSSPFCEVLRIVPADFEGGEGDQEFDRDSNPSDEVKLG